ncbi:hypothetical protein Salat_2093600 [Sesamum alatum]|uniref:Uncharacterized protein n=1 Tax=Sesamum alatum TaxID=300844 RepID=A0AAE2CGJ6_9LAMI|nr:hypothetical protein Salat_2093600 [Sesamum alatum]
MTRTATSWPGLGKSGSVEVMRCVGVCMAWDSKAGFGLWVGLLGFGGKLGHLVSSYGGRSFGCELEEGFVLGNGVGNIGGYYRLITSLVSFVVSYLDLGREYVSFSQHEEGADIKERVVRLPSVARPVWPRKSHFEGYMFELTLGVENGGTTFPHVFEIPGS